MTDVKTNEVVAVMDAETLQALRASIQKWERIVAGTERESESQCPLCEKFCVNSRDYCRGCPVAEKTGQRHCDGTPYYDFRDDGQSSVDAQREVDFLKSLLPHEAVTALDQSHE